MRLIDADELCERILKTMEKNIPKGKLFDNFGLSLAQVFINASPTIDLVRCGECKHYKRDECRLDPFWERYTEPNDFCSQGERRE